MNVYQTTAFDGEKHFAATLRAAQSRVIGLVNEMRHDGFEGESEATITEIALPRLDRNTALAMLNGEVWQAHAPALIERYKVESKPDGTLSLSTTVERTIGEPSA